MNAVEIISKKRDGHPLDPDEIFLMIEGYVQHRIPDYQMSAFLMAVVLRGMTPDETLALTRAMIASGSSIDLSSVPGIKVDKHSTGGVGDKVSLILAPLVACAGVPVPMMAGRGLGHSGGTLDKLEAIPGFRTRLSKDAFVRQVSEIGCAIMGQTDDMVPADKKIYALRDVTGTVSSIPLICASILSKKKAEGTDALILDVKTGKGAFLPSKKETEMLAQSLVELGNRLGIRTEALLTGMDQPLGNAVGNWLEVREAVEALHGKGPGDLMDVVFELGGMMLLLGGKTRTVGEGIRVLRPVLDSGQAFEKFLSMIKSQGGDILPVERPDRYPLSAPRFALKSPHSGYVGGLDAMEVGLLAVMLGTGRMKQDDSVDPSAGIVFYKKTGDNVQTGETLADVYTHRGDVERFTQRLMKAYTFSESPVSKPRMIQGRTEDKGATGMKKQKTVL